MIEAGRYQGIRVEHLRAAVRLVHKEFGDHLSPEQIVAQLNEDLRQINPVFESTKGIDLNDRKIVAGDFTIHPELRTVETPNGIVSLTPTESRLLSLLMKHPDGRLSYQQLASAMVGTSIRMDESYKSNVRVFIAYLRKKIGDTPVKGKPTEYRTIQNVRDYGFRFVTKDPRESKN